MLKEIMEQATLLDGMLRQYQQDNPYKNKEGKFIHRVSVDSDGVYVFMQPSKFLEVCEGCHITIHMDEQHTCMFVDARALRFLYTSIWCRDDMVKYLEDHGHPILYADAPSFEQLADMWKTQFMNDMEDEDEENE